MTKPLAALALLALAGCSPPAETPADPASRSPAPQAAVTGGPIVNLPKQAGPWLRPDTWRRVTADTIFDYMDGGGELYLAYRFDHLDVCEYRAPTRRSARSSSSCTGCGRPTMRSGSCRRTGRRGGEARGRASSISIGAAAAGALRGRPAAAVVGRPLRARPRLEGIAVLPRAGARARARDPGRPGPADAPLLLGEIVMPRGWMPESRRLLPLAPGPELDVLPGVRRHPGLGPMSRG